MAFIHRVHLIADCVQIDVHVELGARRRRQEDATQEYFVSRHLCCDQNDVDSSVVSG